MDEYLNGNPYFKEELEPDEEIEKWIYLHLNNLEKIFSINN